MSATRKGERGAELKIWRAQRVTGDRYYGPLSQGMLCHSRHTIGWVPALEPNATTGTNALMVGWHAQHPQRTVCRPAVACAFQLSGGGEPRGPAPCPSHGIHTTTYAHYKPYMPKWPTMALWLANHPIKALQMPCINTNAGTRACGHRFLSTQCTSWL